MLVGDGMDVKARAPFLGHSTTRFLRVMNFALVFLPENRVLSQLRGNVFLRLKMETTLYLGCKTTFLRVKCPDGLIEILKLWDNNRTLVLMVSNGVKRKMTDGEIRNPNS